MEFNISATAQLRQTLIDFANARGLTGVLKAQGGMIHGPSGVDKVPAWLTAGEFVMNANSSRQFLPILQAMNVQPQRLSRGGSVQNISFGNINVTGGATSKQTARTIAREIKQEMRRGTVSFN